MKKFLTQRFYRVALLWWKCWSITYRFLFQRKFSNDAKLKRDLYRSLTPGQAEVKLAKLTYVKDRLKELGDVCSHPTWTQHCLNELDSGRGQPKGPMDCDESSIWASHSLGDL